MSPLFSKKKNVAGKTVALLDIESGSVGAALVRLTPDDAPKLFAEKRIALPLHRTRDSVALARAVEHATEQALLHISHVATRLREHDALSAQGEVGRAAVFMSAPWATMHLEGGTADFAEPLQAVVRDLVHSVFGDVPTSFHPLGSAAAHGATLIFPPESAHLLCVVGGEVSELLVADSREVLGRATIPFGQRTLVRTLVAHGGVSPAEAASYLALAKHEGHPLFEPLRAAEDHVAAALTEAAGETRAHHALGGVIVLAHEPFADIMARALSRNTALAGHFPAGGTVRGLRAPHVMPYLSAHAAKPDTILMLEALFAEGKFGDIRL